MVQFMRHHLSDQSYHVSTWRLSKSSATNFITILSQLYYMATCEWWNLKPTWIHYFVSNTYNLSHSKIVIKMWVKFGLLVKVRFIGHHHLSNIKYQLLYSAKKKKYKLLHLFLFPQKKKNLIHFNFLKKKKIQHGNFIPLWKPFRFVEIQEDRPCLFIIIEGHGDSPPPPLL